jgi:hypothetical protein
MPMNQKEQVSKSLAQTRRDLLTWGITDLFMRAAVGRGATQIQFADLWRKFVHLYYGRLSTTGVVILDHPSKARYWCLQFLHDEGWKPVQHVTYRERLHVDDPYNPNRWTCERQGRNWRALKLTAKSGRRLGWRLYENPESPEPIEYVYGRPDEPWEPDDAA